MTLPTLENCGHCRFMHQGHRTCRRHPWPLTKQETDWCGEFEPITTTQPHSHDDEISELTYALSNLGGDKGNRWLCDHGYMRMIEPGKYEMLPLLKKPLNWRRGRVDLPT